MEELPQAYVHTASPLVLLSGLGEDENVKQPSPGQETGARVVTESPECYTEQSSLLLQQFLALDGARNGTGSRGDTRYQIRCVGRNYTLPARKSAPIAKSPGAEGGPASRSTELHSPLSPLSPGSPVFPDGLLPPAWFLKHQHQVPCLFLAFFSFDAGGGSSQDEGLKSDINAARGTFTRSGFKTRFAAVLISDTSILDAPEMEERLSSIRRATSLDSKGLYFMPPMSSQTEIAQFSQNLMATLQPFCVEYYRDLAKHARRKKARGGPAPQLSSINGGASQSTSTSGWNVRYDVKLGVFAEFRGELDVAERHFSAAIEELFSSEGGVLETTANWSPRWNEARILSDSIAVRLIRCQLRTGQTSGAAQSWQNYKVRMQDLVDRRGKGSLTYGWSAWEARWASIMSQVIQLAEVPAFQKSLKGMDSSSRDITARQVYASPEKAMTPADRMPPFDFLHHSGYWLRLFASGIRSRWTRALAIPEEDRVPPGQSPASTVANRFVTYDTYLVPEPHEEIPISGKGTFDHVAELGLACIRAAEEFESRQQIRMSEQIRLELAEDFIRAGRYSDAMSLLSTLWEESTWREDSWVVPLERLLHLLIKCIDHNKSEQNAAMVLALTWELLAVGSPSAPGLLDCLDKWESLQPISVTFEDKQRRSPVSLAFAFKNMTAHVGELLSCQLVLSKTACKDARPLQISSLDFRLGEATRISIRHEANAENESYIPLSTIVLHETEDGGLQGSADLSLQSPQNRILSMSMVLRSAQTFSLSELSVYVQCSKFTLVHKFAEESIKPSTRWHVEQDGKLDSVLIPHMDTKSIEVLPKPPKIQVLLPQVREQYYCDEKVIIPVLLINGESEAVKGTIGSSMIDETGEAVNISWSSEDGDVRTISNLESSAESSADILVEGPSEPGTMTLTLVLQYVVLSDPNISLEKTLTLDLTFIPSFETNFIFTPRLHLDPWPSYFDSAAEGTEAAADGILQLWHLDTNINSLIGHPLTIENVELIVHEVQGNCHCSVSATTVTKDHILRPSDKIMPDFQLTTRKFSLDDRSPSYLFLSLVVNWSHEEGSGVAATTIDVPRLTIPTAEPRVLCVVNDSTDDKITLSYHLENPSTHFLTFALSMDASEDFAFSGPKQRALSLAPLSRHQIEYHLVVHSDTEPDSDDPGSFWITPNLSVVDSYYNKSLRIHPGGPGVKLSRTKQIAVQIRRTI